jgi:hypothetical protein
MIVAGSHAAGKSRFFDNIHYYEEILPSVGYALIFRCPPCGTDRDILNRIAYDVGVEECRENGSKSELAIVERIAEAFGKKTTVVIQDAHLMSRELLRSVLYIRTLVEDAGCDLALVLSTHYSPEFFLARGLPEEKVSSVFEIPDMSLDDILLALRCHCYGQTAGVVEEYENATDKSDTLIAELQRRNLVRIGLAVEFTSIAMHQHEGKDLLEVGLGIIDKMTNQCREMKCLPREQQATFPNM